MYVEPSAGTAVQQMSVRIDAPAVGNPSAVAVPHAAEIPPAVIPRPSEDNIVTVEQLLLGYERGDRNPALERLELVKVTKAQVESKIRGLGLNPEKTAQMQRLCNELMQRLDRNLPRVELDAMKVGLERLCCSWGVRVSLLANCKDYSLLAKLLAVAVTMEQ